MTRILRTYIVVGCVLQFLALLVFGVVASIAKTCLAKPNVQLSEISALVQLFLHWGPVLHLFALISLSLWLYAAHAIVTRRPDKVLVHILGAMLVSSIGATLLHLLGGILLPAFALRGIIR